MKIKFIAITLALAALTGCKPSEGMSGKFAKVFTESLSSSADKNLHFSLNSPYAFIINGKKTQVKGVDICYDELTKSSFTCIDLSKPFADVYLLLPEGAQKERWSFVKEENGNYLSLRRPDGTIVIPATEQ